MIRAYALLFGRAWLIVLFTAMNVSFIAREAWLSMFLTGFAISLTWWMNARTAAHSTLRGAALVYAIGAATGTVSGVWLARLL